MGKKKPEWTITDFDTHHKLIIPNHASQHAVQVSVKSKFEERT